jgi:hypothetical protein
MEPTPCVERFNATWFAYTAAALVVVTTAWITWRAPGWIAMWTLAAAEFAALKLLTLRGRTRLARGWKIVAYIAAWPGMDAEAFLHRRLAPADRPALAELVVAFAKLALGLRLAVWAVEHAVSGNRNIVGWIGMLGIIFTLHFGVLHLASWFWRRAGVVAPPIMRAPILARSLAELWGERWNLAFAESARRLILRPLGRRLGGRVAGGIVFLVSGLLHEVVISLPARGGWGGPTLYFLIQAAGMAFERSAAGKHFGLGRGGVGWAWTFVIAAAPLPLLFHAPFVRNVIVPFYRTLSAFLP